MKIVIVLFLILFTVACKEPVPVEDVYQSDKDKTELERQEDARVGSDGLNAVGCPPDDRECAVAASQELLNEINE